MTPDARARLTRKRGLLQLRLKRQQESRQARMVGSLMREAGAGRLSRLPAARARSLMERFNGWPVIDERFDWSKIPASGIVRWEDNHQRDAAFAAAIRRCFAPPTRVAVIFHTCESALLASSDDVATHASVLLEPLWETLWIVARAGSSPLVEVSFIDQEVCWAEPL